MNWLKRTRIFKARKFDELAKLYTTERVNKRCPTFFYISTTNYYISEDYNCARYKIKILKLGLLIMCPTCFHAGKTWILFVLYGVYLLHGVLCFSWCFLCMLSGMMFIFYTHQSSICIFVAWRYVLYVHCWC